MERLLVAVYSDLFAQVLKDTFQNEYEIRTCCDGCEALELLNTFRPHIMILNLCLPRKDYMTILTQSNHTPQVILGITDQQDPFAFTIARQLGVGHILISPTVDSICVSLCRLSMQRHPQEMADPADQTALLLHNLALSANMSGFQMLCIGIPLLAQDPSRRFFKDIYAAIAVETNCSESSVEASIRRAIGSAWERHDPAVWSKHFPATSDGKILCPSNSLFMKTLARQIRL